METAEWLQENSGRLVAGGAVIALLAAAYIFVFLPGQTTTVNVTVLDAATGEPLDAQVSLLDGQKRFGSKQAVDGVAAFSNVPASKKLRAVAEMQGYLSAGAPAAEEVRLSLKRNYGEKGAAQAKGFLIVSMRERLEYKYGEKAADAVAAKIEELAEAAREDGLEAKTVFLDSAELKTKFGITPVKNNEKAEVLRAVRQLNAKLKPSYLLIVGGQNIVPFQEMANPLAEAGEKKAFEFVLKESPEVETDNLYGLGAQGAENEYYPGIAVGRLPDGLEERDDGGTVLLQLMQNAIDAHAKPAELKDQISTMASADSYLDYYDSFAFRKNRNSVLESPEFYYYDYAKNDYAELAVQELKESARKADVVFILLHGNKPFEPQALTGRSEDGSRDLLVLDDGVASQLDWKGKLVLTDSCWGASPQRRAGESVALAALSRGAKAFIGSTQVSLSISPKAYKGVMEENEIEYLGVTNALLYKTMTLALEGKRIGDAFSESKRSLSWGAEPEKLTAAEFVLYGDPTLTLR